MFGTKVAAAVAGRTSSCTIFTHPVIVCLLPQALPFPRLHSPEHSLLYAFHFLTALLIPAAFSWWDYPRLCLETQLCLWFLPWSLNCKTLHHQTVTGVMPFILDPPPKPPHVYTSGWQKGELTLTSIAFLSHPVISVRIEWADSCSPLSQSQATVNRTLNSMMLTSEHQHSGRNITDVSCKFNPVVVKVLTHLTVH